MITRPGKGVDAGDKTGPSFARMPPRPALSAPPGAVKLKKDTFTWL